MKKIAPSILSANILNLKQEIDETTVAGADLIHVDIMDGNFVSNISIGPDVVKAIDTITNIPLDVHLMISRPELAFQNYCLPNVEYISIHAETTNHLDHLIQLIKSQNKKAGVAINPASSIEMIKPILSIVNLIVIMSVNPGFGGQKFIPYTLDKIKELVEIRSRYHYNFLLEIDGGVKLDNCKKIAEAGVDILVAGSAIFGAVCGDIIAAAVTMCSVALPEMRRYKYDDRLSLGCIAAGGNLSFIIPPSIGFIVFDHL